MIIVMRSDYYNQIARLKSDWFSTVVIPYANYLASYRSDALVKDGLHSGENLNVRRVLANRPIGFYIS